MKNKPPSIAESLSYAIAGKALGFIFLLGTLALAIPVLLLWEKTKFELLRVIGCLIFLVGLFASIFTSKEVVARMEEDKAMSFSLAFAHTWYRYLLYLAFIPLVGPLVQRFVERKKHKNPFVVADE